MKQGSRLVRVVLIGDSIRMGYEGFVCSELAGVADVWGPAENGENTRKVLAHLGEWVFARRPSVVHVNCGLHDLKVEFGATERAVPLEEYAANVRRILTQIRQAARAEVIWATTTPVNEGWHHEQKPFDRFEADVVGYNQAAVKVARDLGFPVDDLYAVAMQAGRDRVLLPDGVHFSEEGYALLGKAAAKAIRERCR